VCAPSASQLDLSNNRIGRRYEFVGYDSDGEEQTKFVADPEGVQAIAGALRVNGGLMTLNLSINNIGGEGEASIRDAVQEKAGFELHL
jgi:hypothetical protein